MCTDSPTVDYSVTRVSCSNFNFLINHIELYGSLSNLQKPKRNIQRFAAPTAKNVLHHGQKILASILHYRRSIVLNVGLFPLQAEIPRCSLSGLGPCAGRQCWRC
jgi:hypothetical protein